MGILKFYIPELWLSHETDTIIERLLKDIETADLLDHLTSIQRYKDHIELLTNDDVITQFCALNIDIDGAHFHFVAKDEKILVIKIHGLELDTDWTNVVRGVSKFGQPIHYLDHKKSYNGRTIKTGVRCIWIKRMNVLPDIISDKLSGQEGNVECIELGKDELECIDLGRKPVKRVESVKKQSGCKEPEKKNVEHSDLSIKENKPLSKGGKKFEDKSVSKIPRVQSLNSADSILRRSPRNSTTTKIPRAYSLNSADKSFRATLINKIPRASSLNTSDRLPRSSKVSDRIPRVSSLNSADRSLRETSLKVADKICRVKSLTFADRKSIHFAKPAKQNTLLVTTKNEFQSESTAASPTANLELDCIEKILKRTESVKSKLKNVKSTVKALPLKRPELARKPPDESRRVLTKTLERSTKASGKTPIKLTKPVRKPSQRLLDSTKNHIARLKAQKERKAEEEKAVKAEEAAKKRPRLPKRTKSLRNIDRKMLKVNQKKKSASKTGDGGKEVAAGNSATGSEKKTRKRWELGTTSKTNSNESLIRKVDENDSAMESGTNTGSKGESGELELKTTKAYGLPPSNHVEECNKVKLNENPRESGKLKVNETIEGLTKILNAAEGDIDENKNKSVVGGNFNVAKECKGTKEQLIEKISENEPTVKIGGLAAAEKEELLVEDDFISEEERARLIHKKKMVDLRVKQWIESCENIITYEKVSEDGNMKMKSSRKTDDREIEEGYEKEKEIYEGDAKGHEATIEEINGTVKHGDGETHCSKIGPTKGDKEFEHKNLINNGDMNVAHGEVKAKKNVQFDINDGDTEDSDGDKEKQNDKKKNFEDDSGDLDMSSRETETHNDTQVQNSDSEIVKEVSGENNHTPGEYKAMDNGDNESSYEVQEASEEQVEFIKDGHNVDNKVHTRVGPQKQVNENPQIDQTHNLNKKLGNKENEEEAKMKTMNKDFFAQSNKMPIIILNTTRSSEVEQEQVEQVEQENIFDSSRESGIETEEEHLKTTSDSDDATYDLEVRPEKIEERSNVFEKKEITNSHKPKKEIINSNVFSHTPNNKNAESRVNEFADVSSSESDDAATYDVGSSSQEEVFNDSIMTRLHESSASQIVLLNYKRLDEATTNDSALRDTEQNDKNYYKRFSYDINFDKESARDHYEEALSKSSGSSSKTIIQPFNEERKSIPPSNDIESEDLSTKIVSNGNSEKEGICANKNIREEGQKDDMKRSVTIEKVKLIIEETGKVIRGNVSKMQNKGQVENVQKTLDKAGLTRENVSMPDTKKVTNNKCRKLSHDVDNILKIQSVNKKHETTEREEPSSEIIKIRNEENSVKNSDKGCSRTYNMVAGEEEEKQRADKTNSVSMEEVAIKPEIGEGCDEGDVTREDVSIIYAKNVNIKDGCRWSHNTRCKSDDTDKYGDNFSKRFGGDSRQSPQSYNGNPTDGLYVGLKEDTSETFLPDEDFLPEEYFLPEGDFLSEKDFLTNEKYLLEESLNEERDVICSEFEKEEKRVAESIKNQAIENSRASKINTREKDLSNFSAQNEKVTESEYVEEQINLQKELGKGIEMPKDEEVSSDTINLENVKVKEVDAALKREKQKRLSEGRELRVKSISKVIVSLLEGRSLIEPLEDLKIEESSENVQNIIEALNSSAEEDKTGKEILEEWADFSIFNDQKSGESTCLEEGLKLKDDTFLKEEDKDEHAKEMKPCHQKSHSNEILRGKDIFSKVTQKFEERGTIESKVTQRFEERCTIESTKQGTEFEEEESGDMNIFKDGINFNIPIHNFEIEEELFREVEENMSETEKLKICREELLGKNELKTRYEERCQQNEAARKEEKVIPDRIHTVFNKPVVNAIEFKRRESDEIEEPELYDKLKKELRWMRSDVGQNHLRKHIIPDNNYYPTPIKNLKSVKSKTEGINDLEKKMFDGEGEKSRLRTELQEKEDISKAGLQEMKDISRTGMQEKEDISRAGIQEKEDISKAEIQEKEDISGIETSVKKVARFTIKDRKRKCEEENKKIIIEEREETKFNEDSNLGSHKIKAREDSNEKKLIKVFGTDTKKIEEVKRNRKKEDKMKMDIRIKIGQKDGSKENPLGVVKFHTDIIRNVEDIFKKSYRKNRKGKFEPSEEREGKFDGIDAKENKDEMCYSKGSQDTNRRTEKDSCNNESGKIVETGKNGESPMNKPDIKASAELKHHPSSVKSKPKIAKPVAKPFDFVDKSKKVERGNDTDKEEEEGKQTEEDSDDDIVEQLKFNFNIDFETEDPEQPRTAQNGPERPVGQLVKKKSVRAPQQEPNVKRRSYSPPERKQDSFENVEIDFSTSSNKSETHQHKKDKCVKNDSRHGSSYVSGESLRQPMTKIKINKPCFGLGEHRKSEIDNIEIDLNISSEKYQQKKNRKCVDEKDTSYASSYMKNQKPVGFECLKVDVNKTKSIFESHKISNKADVRNKAHVSFKDDGNKSNINSNVSDDRTDFINNKLNEYKDVSKLKNNLTPLEKEKMKVDSNDSKTPVDPMRNKIESINDSKNKIRENIDNSSEGKMKETVVKKIYCHEIDNDGKNTYIKRIRPSIITPENVIDKAVEKERQEMEDVSINQKKDDLDVPEGGNEKTKMMNVGKESNSNKEDIVNEKTIENSYMKDRSKKVTNDSTGNYGKNCFEGNSTKSLMMATGGVYVKQCDDFLVNNSIMNKKGGSSKRRRTKTVGGIEFNKYPNITAIASERGEKENNDMCKKENKKADKTIQEINNKAQSIFDILDQKLNETDSKAPSIDHQRQLHNFAFGDENCDINQRRRSGRRRTKTSDGVIEFDKPLVNNEVRNINGVLVDEGVFKKFSIQQQQQKQQQQKQQQQQLRQKERVPYISTSCNENFRQNDNVFFENSSVLQVNVESRKGYQVIRRESNQGRIMQINKDEEPRSARMQREIETNKITETESERETDIRAITETGKEQEPNSNGIKCIKETNTNTNTNTKEQENVARIITEINCEQKVDIGKNQNNGENEKPRNRRMERENASRRRRTKTQVDLELSDKDLQNRPKTIEEPRHEIATEFNLSKLRYPEKSHRVRSQTENSERLITNDLGKSNNEISETNNDINIRNRKEVLLGNVESGIGNRESGVENTHNHEIETVLNENISHDSTDVSEDKHNSDKDKTKSADVSPNKKKNTETNVDRASTTIIKMAYNMLKRVDGKKEGEFCVSDVLRTCALATMNKRRTIGTRIKPDSSKCPEKNSDKSPKKTISDTDRGYCSEKSNNRSSNESIMSENSASKSDSAPCRDGNSYVDAYNEEAIMTEKDVYKCNLCPKEFTSPEYVNKHFLRSHHQDETRLDNEARKTDEEVNIEFEVNWIDKAKAAA